MLKHIAATFLAGGLCLTSSLTPAFADMPRMDRWQLSYIDAAGNAADLRTAYGMVGFVRGPRNFVLELACNERDRMVFRLAKREPDKEKFSGDVFAPNFTVLSGRKEIFQQTFARDFQYREAELSYQGPVRKRLMDALARGDAVIVSDGTSAFSARFSLVGSASVISALPCSIDE